MTPRFLSVVLVLVLVLVLDPRTVRADPDADRVSYLARALTALHQLGPAGRDALARDLYEAARARCHAEAATPSAACLATEAATICHADPTCLDAADIVATNLRATNDWIDAAARARLVQAGDYRAALAAELRRRYGALAAELALAGAPGEPAGEAAAIDRLCRDRDRTVHACRPGDAACVPSLPWSRCAAALIWYVGGAP